MPTYDYRCKACEHAFELVQSMRAPVKRKCPACGRLQLERLIGIGAGFIIKGGAASMKAAAAEKAADEKASKEDAKKKSETKADSTPKTKSDTKDKLTSDSTPNPDTTLSSDTSSKDNPKDNPKEKSKDKSTPAEKKLSGSTSTPTHTAREGRGVGNLVDAAKRRVRETKPSKKSAKKPPAKG